MPVLLPVTSQKQSFTTQLGSWKLTFSTYFNVRSQRWMFDMTDTLTGRVMLLGHPFVLGQDFLEPYLFGIGSLIAYDSAQRHAEAGPDDLGVRVVIPYWSPGEIAAAVAAGAAP
jgi:uncharacterized protein DUF6983